MSGVGDRCLGRDGGVWEATKEKSQQKVLVFASGIRKVFGHPFNWGTGRTPGTCRLEQPSWVLALFPWAHPHHPGTAPAPTPAPTPASWALVHLAQVSLCRRWAWSLLGAQRVGV